MPGVFDGGVSRDEMYRVFGMVLACHPDRATEVLSTLPNALVVGEIAPYTAEGHVTL